MPGLFQVLGSLRPEGMRAKWWDWYIPGGFFKEEACLSIPRDV